MFFSSVGSICLDTSVDTSLYADVLCLNDKGDDVLCWLKSLFLQQHDRHFIWTTHSSGSIVNGHHYIVYL